MSISFKKSLSEFTNLLSANLIVQVLGVLSISFFARYFSKIELTAIPIYATIGAMGAVIFGLGLFPLLLKLVPSLLGNNIHDALSISKTVIRVSLIGACIYGLLCFIISEEISSWFFSATETRSIVQIMCIGFFFVSMSTTNTYLLKSFRRFKSLSKVIVIRSLFQVFATVLLSLLLGWAGLVIGLVLGSIVQYSLGIYFLKDIYLSNAPYYPLAKLLKESWSFYLESYLMYARTEGDILVVTSVLGSESLAIYFIAKKVLIGLNSIYESLNSVMITRLSALRDSYSNFKQEVKSFLKIQAYVLLPLSIMFIITIPWLVLFFGGSEYIDSILPASILAITPFIHYVFVLSYNAIIFLFMPSFSRLKLTAVNTTVLLISLYVLSLSLNVVGVSLARLIAVISTGLFAVIYTVRNSYSLSISTRPFLLMVSILITCFGPVMFYQFKYIPSPIISGFLFLAGLVMFLFSISFTISKDFYATLNSLFGLKFKDPIKHVAHEIRRSWHA